MFCNSLRDNFSARVLSWLFPFLIVIVPIYLVVTAVLNDFYVFGDVEDIGWFSAAAWHNNIFLQGPPAHPFSFFNVHMAPILWLTNLVSLILPLSKIDFWAMLSAIIYVGFAACVYRLWLRGQGVEPPFSRMTACTVALAATFSAIGVQALRLPHLEMGIPTLSLWFFYLLSQRTYLTASLPFTLCLLIREDAGLHLFGLLVLTGLTLKFVHRSSSLIKPIAAFAGTALLYALIMLWLKSQYFLAMDNMSYVYTGAPAWQHMNGALIQERLTYFLMNRSFIYLPFFIAIVWAIYERNALIAIGYVAALPWLFLNLSAFRPNPGHLDFYYAFPFWLALAWPLLAPLFGGQPKPTNITRRIFYFLMLLVSQIGFHEGHPVIYPFASSTLADGETQGSLFVPHNLSGQQQAVQNFLTYFTANQEYFDQAAFDMPVIGLVTDTNKNVPWLGAWSDLHPNLLPSLMLYYDEGYEWSYWVKPTLQAYPEAYPYFYTVPHTTIRMTSSRQLEKTLPQPMPFVTGEKPQF